MHPRMTLFNESQQCKVLKDILFGEYMSVTNKILRHISIDHNKLKYKYFYLTWVLNAASIQF